MAEEDILSDFDLDLALQSLQMRTDSDEMERIVKYLGEQIKISRESIEKEWKLLSKEADISLEIDVGSIKDFTQYLQDKVPLHGHICSTEPINLNVFLNNVVQALERNVGQEEKILDELTSFAADEGFILPTPDTQSSVVNIRQSTASLNIVLSENEETTSALWDRIKTMIGKGLLASLDKMMPSQSQLEFENLLTQKVKLLEKLCLLYTPNDVWKKYLTVRNQQIKRFLQNPAILHDTDVINLSPANEEIPDDVLCLAHLSYTLDKMFEQDYNIISLGMFPEAIQMQPEEVFSVYLTDFKSKLHEIVKSLHTQGRRGSDKLNENTGNALSRKILLALQQCVVAASRADAYAKKFLQSLKPSEEPRGFLGTNFGSTFSISSISTSQVEVNTTSEVSTENSPEQLVRDEPEELDTEDQIWFWQEEFKPVISKLALSISETIQLETRAALQKEMQEYERSHQNYEEVDITENDINEAVDYPKLISKSCSVIMAKMDELAPFLLLKPGKEFETVRNSYIESLTANLMSYQSRLVQISSDAPRSSPIRNLYVCFNSAIFIQITLQRYEENYGNIARSLSAVYNDLVESLNEKILSYHFSTLSTVVLQDVQSHHWINQKEFFEGERCSFSVQMWNYYMQGLQHDLWSLCPPLKSQEIFTSVLQYSLACFVRRYSKALPTYKRVKLFRSDITAILFSVSSCMIFPASTSFTDILNPEPKRNVIVDIHNLCSSLLAVMTIIACPLKTLCVFTTGGGEELIKDGKSTVTSWLTWLQPELYGEHCKNLVSMNDIQAVNIYFKLMINQPSPVWRLVLRTVLLRDSYLAVTIVTYLESHQIHFYDEDNGHNESRKRSAQFEAGCSSVVNDDEYYSSIVASLYYVIFKCCERSKSLVNFIIALINRENSWQMFASTEGLRFSEEDQIPVWLNCLFSTFKPFLRRLTDLAVSTLCVKDQTATKSFRFTSMNSLPCGCQVNKPRMVTKPVDKTRLIFEAFERVLKTLSSTVRLLPRIILKLFNRIEDDLRQLKLTSDKAPRAGVRLLGSMLYRMFSAMDDENIPEASSSKEDVKDDCKMLAQIVYHVLLGDLQRLYETCHLPSAVETLLKSKKDWMDEQVKRIGDIISEMDEDELPVVSSQDNLQELQFWVKVKELFLDSKGEKALKQIYKFFVAKKDWIIRRIPLASHLGPLQHAPSKTQADPSTFNAHYASRNLGDYSFNHELIENFPFDWEQIIQSNFGMGLKSLKRLVFNRCELQNEKDVDEDEKDLVEKLKAFYDTETLSV